MPQPFLTRALGAGGRIAVEIAWGADLTAAEGTWAWTDVTTDVRMDPGISTSMGRADEASTTQPATCTMTLDNTAGAYTLGPQSPNYPNVRRNTPVRVRLDPGDGTLRVAFLGFAVGFTPTWNVRGNVRDVQLSAAGTLRRLLQGSTPVLSPIRRALLDRTDVLAYWPCEEGKQATFIAAAVGDFPMAFTGFPEFEGSTAFLCSAPIPVLKRSTWRGEVPPHAATGAVQVRALVAFPSQDEPTGAVLLRVFTSGTAARWDLIYETGSGGLISATVYDRFNVQIADTVGIDFNVNEAPSARRWSLEMVQNGGNIDWRFSTIDANAGGAGYHSPASIVGRTLGAITAVEVNPGGLLDAVAVGHISVQNAQTSIFDDRAQLDAYVGETSFVRYERVCAENGITEEVFGDGTAFTSSADKLGSQPLGAVVELLRQVETADQGVLYDGTNAGLRFNTRRNIENRTPTLTISASTAQLASPFGPVDDDQRTRNRVEAKRTGGSSALREDRTGPLGIDTVGLYDTSIEVNTQLDSAVQLYAGWLLAAGTVEGYRYPTLTVDLLATPALAPAWLTLQPGHRIDITGLGTVLPGHPDGNLSLLVEGISNDLGTTRWIGTARCSPYDRWRIGVVAAETGATGEYLARPDTDGSTLAAAATAGATSISVTTPSGPLWTTTADDLPYDLQIAGRRVTVTACTDPTSPQTMTVAALLVALPAGADVRLWQPTRLGL